MLLWFAVSVILKLLYAKLLLLLLLIFINDNEEWDRIPGFLLENRGKFILMLLLVKVMPPSNSYFCYSSGEVIDFLAALSLRLNIWKIFLLSPHRYSLCCLFQNTHTHKQIWDNIRFYIYYYYFLTFFDFLVSPRSARDSHSTESHFLISIIIWLHLLIFLARKCTNQ